MRLSRFVPPKL